MIDDIKVDQGDSSSFELDQKQSDRVSRSGPISDMILDPSLLQNGDDPTLDPLEHGTIFTLPKGGLSHSSNLFRDMALGFNQQISPPLSSTKEENSKQSQDPVDPFHEIDQPINLQPPPVSNWDNWETEDTAPSTVQWGPFQEFPQEDILLFPSVATAHFQMPDTSSMSHPDGRSDTLCDEQSLPQYMKTAGTSSSQCEECSNLINQITSVLQHYETSQKELSTCKQQLEIYHGDTSLLLSPEDCDHFENEIYALLLKIKSKKVRSTLRVVIFISS